MLPRSSLHLLLATFCDSSAILLYCFTHFPGMRSIARQSARLASHNRAASCSRIRQASIPRSVAPQQRRAFQYSATRASDARPPSDHNARLEQQREEQRKAEEGATKAEQASETTSAEPKTDGDVRKLGLRGRLRNRRIVEVPKPPPIPGWFLEHNVTLVQDMTPPHSAAHKETRQIIRCVDTKTGHTLFTVPYYDPAPRSTDPRSAVQVEIGGQVIDISVLGISLPFWDKLSNDQQLPFMVQELVKQRARPPNEVDLKALGELLVALPRKLQDEVLKTEVLKRTTAEPDGKDGVSTELHNPCPEVASQFTTPQSGARNEIPQSGARDCMLFPDFFTQDIPPSEQSTSPVASDENWSTFQHLAEPDSPSYFSRGYVFLEAEAGIHAGLSLPREGSQSSSFASNRVDISLHCPDSNEHDEMDRTVRRLAEAVHANIIRLDANDIEDLTAEYVGQGQDSPGSFSVLGYDAFEGYEASAAGQTLKPSSSAAEDADELDVDEDEYDEEEDEVDEQSSSGFANLDDLRKALEARRSEFSKALDGARVRIDEVHIKGRTRSRSRSPSSSSDFVQWDNARLRALLDGLLDAAKLETAPRAGSEHPDTQLGTQSAIVQDRRTRTAQLLVGYLSKNAGCKEPSIQLEAGSSFDTASPILPTQRTIVHVRDLKDICRSRLGDAVVKELVHVVQKRRRAGESVLIVGTTAQASNNVFMSRPHEAEDFPFRTITLPPAFKAVNERYLDMPQDFVSKTLKQPAYKRILEINLRHVQSMLRRLQPGNCTDLLRRSSRDEMALRGTHVLTEKILSLDAVQRIVLTAIGLTQSHAASDKVQPIHIALATYITGRADRVVQQWSTQDRLLKSPEHPNNPRTRSKDKDGAEGVGTEAGPNKVERIRKACNPHETRLLTGVVDSANIKTGFSDVHAPRETIDALKTLTTLSLLRPEAFKYGVLANDRLPGLLLYGPPGTGKTMLAKAVAKESKATVLEVSGAQIYEKYVGEGEKMVRAVFSLAKKLSPCVVFIDEADAIFGARSSAGNRNTHREIINQFLREWDGMDDHSVFMMVATNRPFDLDDAVLRRLPRRLLVDLPVAKDRESILGIHLKSEALDESVALGKLAEQTPLYSGSDLKNLCVSAALACVREENEQLAAHKGEAEFKFPEKRTLNATHFEKAIAEISASISEDMSSLTAIRKFDEQYGDRRGRRKKAGYGFGVGAANAVVDENSVRVRQSSTSQQGPPPS